MRLVNTIDFLKVVGLYPSLRNPNDKSYKSGILSIITVK
jgi:hypothetical protein